MIKVVTTSQPGMVHGNYSESGQTFMPSHLDTARSGLSARRVRSALNAPMFPIPAPSAPILIADICNVHSHADMRLRYRENQTLLNTAIPRNFSAYHNIRSFTVFTFMPYFRFHFFCKNSTNNPIYQGRGNLGAIGWAANIFEWAVSK